MACSVGKAPISESMAFCTSMACCFEMAFCLNINKRGSQKPIWILQTKNYRYLYWKEKEEQGEEEKEENEEEKEEEEKEDGEEEK